MPREVKKYLCDFKCGHKATSKYMDMLDHETRCWLNPETKSCSTCKNEVYELDGCEHPELDGCPSEKWFNRSCLKVPFDDFDKMLSDKKYRPYHSDDNFHIKPITNCPFWEKKCNQ